jgi:hypothetical protein
MDHRRDRPILEMPWCRMAAAHQEMLVLHPEAESVAEAIVLSHTAQVLAFPNPQARITQNASSSMESRVHINSVASSVATCPTGMAGMSCSLMTS